MSTGQIIYEQPLNELVRVCLRLEHLFLQMDLCLRSERLDDRTQTLVKLIIDILNVLNRPDVKSKLTQEFNRVIAYFAMLEKMPDISHETLQETSNQLNHLLSYFLNTPGKIGQNLRNNEFIAAMRHSLMSPGGDSSFDTPAYHYWLHQPNNIHQEQIHAWLSTFDEVRAAIELLLSIIRHSSEPRNLIAEKGFYHEALDPKASIQLIRVELKTSAKIYPEISAGRHRMSVRFVIPNLEARPKQTPENTNFQLTLCTI